MDNDNINSIHNVEGIKKNIEQTIHELLKKYQDNESLLKKMESQIVTTLPSILRMTERNQKEKSKRKELLTKKRSLFINRYMERQKNLLFYSPITELFMVYDGQHYNIKNEDDIQYEVLTKITNEEKDMMKWKFQIKNNIMKTLRKKHIFHSIPDTKTIQFVINQLYPYYFKTKTHAKYFLTILGDNLVHRNDKNDKDDKTEDIIVLTNTVLKELLNEISHTSNNYFGLFNVTNSIKFKYYGHDYKNCRILNTVSKPPLLSKNLSKHMLDLLCVACHYSNRYKNSDEFIKQHCSEVETYNNVMYLKNHNKETIVENFINDMLEDATLTKRSIPIKNMMYLWKQYIDKIEIPNVLFNEPLKQIFRTKMKYDEEKQLFLDKTSKYLPNVSCFLQFWKEYMIKNEGMEEVECIEYEISELIFLIKKWGKEQKKKFTVDEDGLLNMIKHYYPYTEIEHNKFILNMDCLLWKKQDEIKKSLNDFKIFILEDCKDDVCISTQRIYNMYEYYNQNCKSKLKISKRYFEKYVTSYIDDFIDSDGFINDQWFYII